MPAPTRARGKARARSWWSTAALRRRRCSSRIFPIHFRSPAVIRPVSGSTSLLPGSWSSTFSSAVRSQGSFLVVDGGAPTATLLYQNFPNPFPVPGRDSTCLWFDIASAGLVELDILDLRGNRVRLFVPGPDFPAILAAGRYGRGYAGG